MTTLQQVTELLHQVVQEIAQIKGRNPGFHNETNESTLGPEAKSDFRRFMYLKASKIDFERRIKRAEEIRVEGEKIRQARSNSQRTLNLSDDDDDYDHFHLPPPRESISTRVRSLSLSPVSDSGSVHSLDSRSGSQSPILGLALLDSDKC